jgi:guanylate kinase
MLIVLTGPAGAGKTSVADELATRFPRSVSFSLDTIRHFVKGGYCDPWGQVAVPQVELARAIAVDMIRRYTGSGYVTIVDGIFFEDELHSLRREFEDVHAFALLPSLETVMRRDRARPADQQQPARSEELHREFSSAKLVNFKVIDSTEQTVRETVASILRDVSS